jgi:Glycosyltransferase family 28 C-terminal domain
MSRIVFCWEMGDDFGHLGNFYPIVKLLSTHGHEIIILVKEIGKVGHFNWPERVKIIPSPQLKLGVVKPRLTTCFADILLSQGYGSVEMLKYAAIAWKNIFDLIQPDIIVFDHAPTALLSVRGKKIAKIITSYSFITPPAGSLPVNYRPWETPNNNAMNDAENIAIDNINQVAKILDLVLINHSSDLFDVDKTIIYGYREIDIYRTFRTAESYTGSLIAKTNFQPAKWKKDTAIKIFAYLKYGYKQSDMMLSILSELQANVICFYSGASIEDCQQYSSSHQCVSNSPFDLCSVYDDVDLVISHAGGGMVYSALHFGRPMIFLPLQLEQYNTAHILESMKVSVSIDGKINHHDAKKKIQDFMHDPAYLKNAMDLSKKIKENDHFSSEKEIVETIERLLKS